MTASRIGSFRHKLLASVIALVIAGMALVLALPNFYSPTPFHTIPVFARALDDTTIALPIQLSEAIILEPGAIIRSQKNGNTSDGSQTQRPNLILKNATLTVVQAAATLGRAGTVANMPNKSPAPDLAIVLRELGFEALKLDDALIQLKRPGGGLQQVGRISGLVTIQGDPQTLNAKGVFKRNGVTLSYTAKTIENKDDPTGSTLGLEITGKNLELSLNGKLFTTEGARVTSEDARFKTKDMKQVLRWLGMESVNSAGLAGFSATGYFDWTGSTIAFDQSQFEIDGNQANGRLSFYLDPREPSIEGTLAFQKMELTPYLGTSDQPTAIDALTKAWSAIHTTVSRGLLPLGLKDIDADIRISAKSVQHGGTEIGHGAAVVLVKDGKLKADIADMTLASGAKGRSQIEIDSTEFVPGYVLHGNMNGFDLGSASVQWFGKPVVDGVANMTFDLAAQGRNKAELLSTLSGPIVVSAQNGASIPINLVKLFTTTKEAPNDGWQHIESGFTTLKDLSVEVVSSKGSLKTQSVRANIDGNAIVATGTLKLKDLVLDLILTKLAATDESAAANPATSESPKKKRSQQDALEFKGPITEPIIRFLPKLRKG